MKNLLMTLMLILPLGLAGDAADTYPITTADGESVDVTKAEIIKAYKTVLREGSTNYEKAYLNDDGTITFLEPRYKYIGHDVDIHGDSHDGACRLFGLPEYVDHYEIIRPGRHVYLTRSGRLKEYKTRGRKYVISYLTCRHPDPDDEGDEDDGDFPDIDFNLFSNEK